MKVVVVALIVVLAVYAVDATIFTREQSERLSLVRQECEAESELGPYEIGNIVRAIRPTEKLVASGQCVLRRLNENDDKVARDILYQIRAIFEGGILPKTITQLIAACEEAVGFHYCKRVVNLVKLILEFGRQNGIAL